ncbi:MAG TPA: aminoglycoside phosphotransferase family protein [Microlunatus sp.]
MPSYEPPSPQARQWILDCVDPSADVVQVERLLGGLTASMDRIVLRRRDGTDRRVVLRRWAPSDRHAQLVTGEAQALAAVAGHGIGAPVLLATDPDGAQAGAPSLLMTEVPGEVLLTPPDLDDWLSQLAERQASIHALPPTIDTPSCGWFSADRDFGWVEDAGLRRDAVAAASASTDTTQPALVHGDYQHFNVLWTGTELSGVVDWTMTGTGPIGVDVGHCRLNLAVLFSAQAAGDYLKRYEAAAGIAVDPGSDLRALLMWSHEWEQFIPIQVAGRRQVDPSGMRDRVVETIRQSLTR